LKGICPYPHSDVERELWNEDYNDHVTIASLVDDIRESSLLFSVAIECLMKKFSGTFKLICETCYRESIGDVRKHRHVPECQSSSGHYWAKNKKLVFENSSDNRLIGFDDVSMHDKEEQGLVVCVKLLMNVVSVDDIAGEAARLRQAYSSVMLHAARKAKCKESDLESDDSDNDDNCLAKTDKEIFDEDATDVLDAAAFGADSGDKHKDKHARSRVHVKGDYYKMWTEEQTQDNSEVVYGCGKIRLHGAFAGSCLIVGGKLNGFEVKLLGRFNCGPAFDGDDVCVKVYKKDERKDSQTDNSNLDDSKAGNSSKFYGTVVKVMKRNVHRTARTFVCTVGRYDGHLMTPLCGTAPKFRIVDSCLFKRYGPAKKGSYVAVYDTDLELIKTVKLDPRRRKEMLFVVKYLKWENEHEYPLGYVCHILHESCTVEDSLKMLNLMYELPTNEKPEPDKKLAEQEEEDAEAVKRKDLCRMLTVSIDAPGTKALDDALSLEESDGRFVVWTHVADVTHYIQKDDVSDIDAQRHMLSFDSFPSRPVHMLPKKLAEDECSLLENRRQRAMSVRFEMTASGEVLTSEGPLPSWIQNNKQLFYDDVQELIDCPPGVQNYGDYDDQAVSRDIEQMVIHLHRLATELRKRRIGDSSHYYEYSRKHCFNREGIDDPFDVDQNHDAQRLVEEFMILTNQHVGRQLKQKFPDCTPFLVHSAPKGELLDTWKRNHGYIIPFSFYFSQFTQHLGAGHCSGVTQLFMLRKCLDALSAAVDQDEVRKVRTIIGSELLHPLHSTALSSWFDIQEPSHYTCYVDDEMQGAMHFGLHTCDYVHFTSPLRRYVDIIAHRLVKADPVQPLAYTQDEVMALCEKMDAQKSRQRSYDEHCALLEIAGMLQRPMYIPCYVETFNDFSIRLVSPYFQTGSPLACTLKFSEMTLCDNPVTHDRKLTLIWSKRYYDTRMSRTINARSDSVTEYVLDSGMFGTTLCPHVWRSMHRAVKGQTEHLIARVSKAVWANRPMQQQRENEEEEVRETVQEVTSEMADNKPLVRHHVKFSCDITKGTVLSVQFDTKAVKGILQPVINLVNLTNDKDICVEHQRDPVAAFASVATRKIKDTYLNIEEYQIIWQAVLEMEAATNVVRNDSIVCSHVPVKFVKRNERIYGRLELSTEFCDKRSISMFRVSEEEETHDYTVRRALLVPVRRRRRANGQ